VDDSSGVDIFQPPLYFISRAAVAKAPRKGLADTHQNLV
jgi:hypothetical protein